MDYSPITSTSIAAIGYDDDSNTLGVRFLKGTEYHYYGVPRDVFDGLRAASSVGQFFDQYVRKAGYAFARVG